MREWLARLFDRLRRSRLERELGEELAFHEEQLERAARAAGAGARQARHLARRRLGEATRIREAAREFWSIRWLDRLQQDVSHALRRVRRSPGFAVAVTLTLSLGIGANVAMFGLVDRLMFRPLEHLHDEDAVQRIYLQWTQGTQELTEASMSFGRYLDMQKLTRSFSGFAAFASWPVAVGIGEAARERPVAAATASLFGFFDVRPALGRFFTAQEDVVPAGAPVAVLSHAFWRAEFEGRADVLGRTLHVGDIVVTVIGVAPRGFTLAGVNDLGAPALFVPAATAAQVLGTPAADFYGYTWMSWATVIARRHAGVSVGAAAADVSRAHRLSWAAERAASTGPTLGRPVLEHTPEAARPRAQVAAIRRAAGPNPIREARIALWLTGVALLVLLVACSNIANLFLVREISRRHETAIRLALGVTRGRLFSQAVTEGLLITLLGAALGLLLAHWAGSAVLTLLPHGADGRLEVFTDGRTVLLALLLALGPGLIVAILPAVLAGRRDLAPTLRAAGRGVHLQRTRLRAGLLILQAAFSVLLLVGATLFARSLAAVEALPLGYDMGRVLVATPTFRATPLAEEARRALYRALLAEAQALPGVEAASWSRTGPTLGTIRTRLYVPGIDSTGALGTFALNAVSPDYFRVLGTGITRGRGVTAQDEASAPGVALVSERTAQALWPGQSALGQCVRIGADTVPCSTVVGVVEDVVTNMWNELGGTPQPYFLYQAVAQSNRGDGRILLRVRGQPAAQAEAVRRALQRLMPGAAYVNVQPLRQVLDIYHRPWRVGARIFGAFGLLALLVASVGLYGVISYNVTQRMPELGVRITLGARRSHIVRLVVGQSARLALAGIVLGTLLALLASRWLEPLLFRQSATDARVFGLVAAVMLAVAALASSAPALRALRADPNHVLRAD